MNIRQKIILLFVFISLSPVFSAFSQEETDAGGPAWKCEFGWNPPSFLCSPNEEETSTTDIESEKEKQQAALIQTLQKKENEIKQRELLLVKRQNELRELEQRIERKLNEIKKIQLEIAQARQLKKEEDARDLSTLVKMYEKMDAENAAAIFNTMDQQTAVNLLLRMNPRKGSAILQTADPKVAQDITERIAHIKANRELVENL